MATIDGTNGDDVLYALASEDVVNGLDGDDKLYTVFDANTLSGGEGNDALRATASFSILDGGAGDDTIAVNLGHDNVVTGGAGDDAIRLGPGDLNYVSGGDGNDRLEGDRVSESGFHAGSGHDAVWIDQGILVLVDGGDGDDVLSATGSQVDLLGGEGNDVLDATYAAQSAFGNYLDGGSGDDVLVARGQATLTGGEGRDTFVVIGTDPNTYINDFSNAAQNGSQALRAEDVLDLRETLQSLSVLDKPLGALVGQGYLVVNSEQNVGGGETNDTVVQIDPDGRAGDLPPVTTVTLLDTSLATQAQDMNNWMV